MQHKKIVGILYIPGAAGGILTRVLQAHKESYWNSEWLNHDNLDITSPLEFPSNPIGFRREDPDHGLADSYYLYSAHGMRHHGWNELGKFIPSFKIDPTTHTLFYDALKDHESLLLGTCPQKNYIYCYAQPSYFKKRYKYVFEEDLIAGKQYGDESHDLYTKCAQYTVNIENLLNIDYYVFEEEYNKLISHYNLTSRISGVRAYILAWIERQSLDPSKHINY